MLTIFFFGNRERFLIMRWSNQNGNNKEGPIAQHIEAINTG